MTRTSKTSIAITIAALTAAAGAGPMTTIDADQQGIAPPERFADGRLNHQLNPDDPFILMPLSALPDDIVPIIVAGDPNGSPPDTPTNRISTNTLASAYAGTANILIGGSFFCSATPIADRYLISAGHCVDSNGNGTNDFGTNIRVTFNANGNSSTVIFPSGVAAVHTHPNFTGFANPSINDDIIIIELVNDLPAEIPRYPVYRGALSSGAQIHLVGYGTTGDAVNGYINGTASFNIKRAGRNNPDSGFFPDDEGTGIAEIFQYNIDHWQLGGLGNDVETTVGGGDSGGPAYLQVGDHLELWGVNTFTAGNAPLFESLAGGMLVNGYLDFIDSIVDPVPGVFSLTAPDCGGAANQFPAVFLDWNGSILADSYTVTIATDAGLVSVVYSQSGIAATNHNVPGGALDGCTEYFWSVTAVNINGQTQADNAVCTFTTTVIGDLNADGVVDTADLGGLIGSFGGAGPFGDINGDGIVDTADLGTLIGNFGQSCL